MKRHPPRYRVAMRVTMDGGAREFHVRVKPGSSKGPLVEVGDDDILTVYVRERAIEGKANDAVERALAAHFGEPPSRVRIVRGHTARIKTVRVG